MPKLKIASRVLALASVLLLSLSGCGGGGDNSSTEVPPVQASTGVVSGRVADAETGEAVSGVTVRIGAQSATSDANGKYSVASVPVGTNVVAQFSKTNYASNFATVEVLKARTSVANRGLSKVGVKLDVNAATGGTVVLAGSPAQVQLPAGGIVNVATGAAFTGTMSVEMTPINPARNPASMPGNYRAQGETAPIESMGALQVEMRDSTGALLNLAPGKTATIRIPVPATSVSPPLTIPLYYFKESTGLWVREGTATLAGSPPQQYYEGQVSHFTAWNADQPLETITIKGCVVDEHGQPLVASVSSLGLDYTGTSTVQTDAGGLFSVPARRNSHVLVTADVDTDSGSVDVSTGSSDLTLSSCIVVAAKPPVILTPPTALAIAPGTFGSLAVIATNAAHYQWFHDGVAMPGSDWSVLLLAGQTGAAGNYYVVVSNVHGSVQSAPVAVTVSTPVVAPVILSQPQDASVLVGGVATFTVQAQGNSLTYQWLRNEVAIPGANGPQLILPAAVAGDDGAQYRVRVSNVAGSPLSNAATLHVTADAVAPAIVQAPANATVAVGQSATFAVQASGTGPLTYQWLRNGTAIPNANGSSYQTPATVAGDTGALFAVRVSNTKGNVTSATASLTVSQASTVSGLYLSFAQGASINGEYGVGAISANGGAAVSLMAPGQGSDAGIFGQAQVSNGLISGVHIRNLLFWKNQQLVRRELVSNSSLPAEVRVSNLSTDGVCNFDTSSSGFASQGNDYADSSRSWRIVQKQGADGTCDTDDDRFFAVRLTMSPTDSPIEVSRPVATVHTSQGVLSGWVVRNGQQLQRVNADFSNPVTLFTLPGDDLDASDDTGDTNGWIFTSGTGVYAVDLSSAAPVTPTKIATLAGGETVTSVDYGNADDAVVAIGGVNATRVVRFVVSTKAVSALGVVAANSTIGHVTPSRVIMVSTGGTVVALPLAGGAVQTVYTPPTATFPIIIYHGGERLWIQLPTATLSVNSNGSDLQTITDSRIAGCISKAFSRFDGLEECDAVMVVIGGSVARSYDAATGTARITYGNVTATNSQQYSLFTMTLAAWGQTAVLTQVVANLNNSAPGLATSFFLKTDQAGLTPIVLQ
ncbi:MAG: carboxypeptidase regulatory-like domain-containing protein [Massilia sp.]